MTRLPSPASSGTDIALPSVGVVLSGGLWGLFWIPLRAIDDAGVEGGWGSLAFFALCVAGLLPIALLRWRKLRRGGLEPMLAGFATGGAFALYALSLLHTDVVRAILLFYLTPVWSTVLARILLGEPISGLRLAALGAGLVGLIVILGVEGSMPLPRNAGDWMALVSGISWAYGSLRVYDRPDAPVFESGFAFFACGLLVALMLIGLPLEGNSNFPRPGAVLSVLWLVVPVALGFGVTVFVILWGATLLSPVRIGLLLMGEVVVGVASAAVLADEPFGWRELAGTVLIVTAAILEVSQAAPRRPVGRA